MRTLLRMISGLAVALGVLGLSVAPAHADTNFANAPSGAHYAKGYSEPVCQLSGVTVTCTATQIAGVGNTNADVSLSVTTTFTGYCHNPGTNDKVVDPFTESDTSTTSQPLSPSRNGVLRVPQLSATGTSSSEFEESFSCPNSNWTPEVTGEAISWSYTLTFEGFTEPAISISG